jgi:hypothetical protein
VIMAFMMLSMYQQAGGQTLAWLSTRDQLSV